MYKWFHPMLYGKCNYLSNLGLKFTQVSKRNPCGIWNKLVDIEPQHKTNRLHNSGDLLFVPVLWHIQNLCHGSYDKPPLLIMESLRIWQQVSPCQPQSWQSSCHSRNCCLGNGWCVTLTTINWAYNSSSQQLTDRRDGFPRAASIPTDTIGTCLNAMLTCETPLH